MTCPFCHRRPCALSGRRPSCRLCYAAERKATAALAAERKVMRDTVGNIMRHIIAAMLALLPLTASAQTIVADVTLPEAYRHAHVQVVEADGNPATIELLATRTNGQQSVGRPECAGPWVYPDALAGLPWAYAVVLEIQGRHFWVVRSYMTDRVVVLQMDAPTCLLPTAPQ